MKGYTSGELGHVHGYGDKRKIKVYKSMLIFREENSLTKVVNTTEET